MRCLKEAVGAQDEGQDEDDRHRGVVLEVAGDKGLHFNSLDLGHHCKVVGVGASALNSLTIVQHVIVQGQVDRDDDK